MGHALFTKYHRAIDLFGKNVDYYDPDTHLDNFAFGNENFKIGDVYQYYYGNVSISAIFKQYDLIFGKYRPKGTQFKRF